MLGAGRRQGDERLDLRRRLRSDRARIPDATCQVQGDVTLTWGEFDRGANGLACHLLDAGLGHQAKVAAYLTNCPGTADLVAAFKAAMAPVDTLGRAPNGKLDHRSLRRQALARLETSRGSNVVHPSP